MDFSFGHSTVKTITITYNVLAAFCGIALIGIGWSNLDEADDFERITGVVTPKGILVLLILCGVVFVALRFIGFGGLCYKRRLLVLTYGIVSLGVAVPLILIAFIVYAQHENLAELYYEGILRHFTNKPNDRILHQFQEKYECCGDISPRYWTDLPDSCCINGRCDVLSTILVGCAPRMEYLIEASASVIWWTSVGVSVVGLFGVFLSWCIYNHLELDFVDEDESFDEKPRKESRI